LISGWDFVIWGGYSEVEMEDEGRKVEDQKVEGRIRAIFDFV
jgi:hypothetical protein